MNVFACQSIQAQIELEQIADVKYQIMTPQSSAPIISIKEDALVGSFNMTGNELTLDWRTAMNMLSSTKLSNYNVIKKNENMGGKDVFSLIIPKKINMFKGDATKTIISVKNGEIVDGRIVDAAIGAKKKNNLIQLVLDEYGVDETVKFLDNITRLANNFNLYHGMTIGIGDLDISYDLFKKMYQVFQTKKLEVKHEITEVENNPDMMDEELFEVSIKQKLDIIRDDIGKLIFNNFKPNNNLKIMNECGSKGTILNIGQMGGCVGNQDFQGGRMPKNYNSRTLPYFFKNDDSAEARGFIEGSFLNGLNLSEFIFHHVTGREGLIDQALKTALSGYLQRKFIKAAEDFMIKYDGTVRNAVERIQQFIYGDSGIDTVKQYDYKFKIMEMNNKEIEEKFKFTKEELKSVKNFTEKDNENFYLSILKMRDDLRNTQVKATINYLALNTNYMLPVNINRIIDNTKNKDKDEVLTDAEYIIKMIENILLPDKCRLYSMTENEMKNEKSPKLIDDKISKTAFRYALYESLAPKKCIYVHKLTKKQLESISEQIISSFNRSVVEPGEMVGILGAQSLGEPVTQMVLNSVDWKEEIMVRDDDKKEDIVIPIGKFIDEIMEKEKNNVKTMGDNFENNMKGIYYLDTNTKNYLIQSVDEQGTISWKKIEALTKHLPINKDGSNTLIKVTTRTGKTVIATKGKSFLTQKDNKVVPIRGDEIKVGDYLPIMKDNKNIDNGYYDIYPSVKLESNKNTNFRRDKLVDLLNTEISDNDKQTINTIINNDVFFDEIISIQEVKPSNTWVYDFTIADTQNFIMANGLCMRDSFHNTGIGGLGGANLGVPRMQEVFSLTKNMKAPFMMVYLDKEHREKKDYAKKIASYIKFTTIHDLRTNIEIYYDPKPYETGGFMEKDNVYNIFYAFQQSKSCCLNKIDGLPWLMRIEFDKEKLMNKEVSLLDIKSKFCVEWEKRFQDVKSMKREKRQLLEKITQLAVLTNTDNDNIPTMHLRFDLTNFNSSTLIDFMDMFVDEFKLKGMPNIEDIAGGSAIEERLISFDNPEGTFEKNKNEYVIYTKGINMSAIRDIIGVDLTRTYCNDIITTYETLGIEAARTMIIREITSVFAANGSAVNHQHVSIFGDLMTNVGTLTSVDRHGLNKLDTDPLARASFEKTVEQLITAAVFNEVDHMKSVSSRIMAGLCIKGGTGLCNLILDKDLLENSEYTVDIGQLYNKTYEDIVPTHINDEIETDIFIPEFKF
jgi:DNA-directed RNA polymerase beta' subunit